MSYFVHFKRVSEPDDQFGAILTIHNAVNAKDAKEKAYLMLMCDPKCRKFDWKLDKIEMEA